MSNGAILLLMTRLFLGFGYMGVPVAFALMAGVLVACSLTPISMQSMVGQMFHGVDSEILLAVPFFLLVGELMTSADVTNRMIRLAQTLVGHMRGGLAQVVTLFSMFFAGVSGSSTADVAVLSRTVAPEMGKEGYDRAFTAALIACASTMANLIPPSIMAVVYGATGNVSIGGLFLAGIVPGVLIGIGLMIYSHFFGPVGIRKPRATLCEFADAARASVLPLMIPLIIMGGILTGWFTPTEGRDGGSGLYPGGARAVAGARPHSPSAARLRLYGAALFHSARAGSRGIGIRLDAGLSARTRYRLGLDRAVRRP
jgi:tripartite ATP-independent transporter DctM subunit